MKYLLPFILFITILCADNINHPKIKLIEKIILEVSINKKMEVWSDNKEIFDELTKHNKLVMASRCEESTIIILEDKNNLTKECSSKHIFVLNYKLLSEAPQSFGALFWKKGRPNIVIIKSRIKAQSIQISNDLKPYLEEKVG
jgi:hypothetical protein